MGPRSAMRLQRVEEDVRLENAHDLARHATEDGVILEVQVSGTHLVRGERCRRPDAEAVNLALRFVVDGLLRHFGGEPQIGPVG